MPLSLSKLEKLLALKGFAPSKFFIIHNICVYIEVLSLTNAEIFLMYIPSKYKFVVSRDIGKSIPIYKLKYLDLDETNNTADDYAGEPEENVVENIYQEIDVNMSPTKGHDIGSNLEENYKRHIILKDIVTEDFKEIRDITRQLKRLRFCVQNVKYKIAILYKNYLCTIKRDDSIECYAIRKYNSKNSKKLFITVDIELFYEKMDSLILNMSTIRKGLYHILDKNHFRHTRTLQKLLEEKGDIMIFSDAVYTKKVEYEKYLKEAYEMLESINLSEKSISENIYQINEQYNNPNLKGLHNDIEKSHQLTKHNKDLSEIQRIKEDVVKTIFELKTKREDTMLNVDKIMFDNNVMVECVLRNFLELGKLCK
jgi:hypothetical protein